MFAERFDALMSIAGISNTMLGRAVHINSSHIGRLRTGVRPLSKNHEYLAPMCRYLAEHLKKDYQLNALQKLTGIGTAALDSVENMALYLEQWLLELENDTTEATGRLISGFSRIVPESLVFPTGEGVEEMPQKYAAYLYGNSGKRKAVEQFFQMILQEEKPQTLLLFSDENLAWLYEDPTFAARWAELFAKVLLKGNRVRIIHTLSRDLNEFLEAVTKWLPIYTTGRIEPYYYPRLRDGIFHRTMFIAPNTAAVISSSVQQNTDGMLHLFLTNRAAVEALALEYERYFSLCRPLMRIFKEQDAEEFRKAVEGLSAAEGDSCLCCAMPPLFSMPENLARELSAQGGNEELLLLWKKSGSSFQKHIKKQTISLLLSDPEMMRRSPGVLRSPLAEIFAIADFTYSPEQYSAHMDHLMKLERQYENLKVNFQTELFGNVLLYAKEDCGVIMAKADRPITAFVINERNMVNAVWDYLTKRY